MLEDPPARTDDPRVDDLGQEAEAIRPVGCPAVQCQTQLVLHHVRRQTGVLREVIALRVRLQGELDAHATQCLLERFGGGLLLGPLGPVGDVGLEAVRLSTGFE